MAQKDERIKIMNEILSGIKVYTCIFDMFLFIYFFFSFLMKP